MYVGPHNPDDQDFDHRAAGTQWKSTGHRAQKLMDPNHLLLQPYLFPDVGCFSHPLLSVLIPSGHFFFLVFSRASPMAYGGSQTRGLIRAIAARLHHSHSNAESKLRL